MAQESTQGQPEKSSFPVARELDNLPIYPSDAPPDILVPNRRFPVVELSAGALIGIAIGLFVSGFDLIHATGHFFLCVGLGLVIGGFLGILVGHFTGATGRWTAGSVLAAVPRVLLGATFGLLFVIVCAMLGVVFAPTRRNDG